MKVIYNSGFVFQTYNSLFHKDKNSPSDGCYRKTGLRNYPMLVENLWFTSLLNAWSLFSLSLSRGFCPSFLLSALSLPESSFPLTSGRKRELWEQPFQACAIDADCAVKPRALVFQPLVKGNEHSGNQIECYYQWHVSQMRNHKQIKSMAGLTYNPRQKSWDTK